MTTTTDEQLLRWGINWRGRCPIVQEISDGYWTPWHLAQEALTAMAAERDALRADAEMLRFIRGNMLALIPEFEGGWDVVRYGEDGSESMVGSGQTLPSAIDAAMKGVRS